jgi:hypothetical protein
MKGFGYMFLALTVMYLIAMRALSMVDEARPPSTSFAVSASGDTLANGAPPVQVTPPTNPELWEDWKSTEIDEDGIFTADLLRVYEALQNHDDEQLDLHAAHRLAVLRYAENLSSESALLHGVLFEATSSVRTSTVWRTDRAGRRYNEYTAERGTFYATFEAELTDTTDTHAPVLPTVWVYALNEEAGTFDLRASMRYGLYRWSDYGAFLGNHHDPRADFRYSEAIRFTLGAVLDDALREADLFFVLAESPEPVGFLMERLRYGRPALDFRRVATWRPPARVTSLESFHVVAVRR